MGAIIVYILKSSLCLALFYLFFKWLMSKEAFFRLNRFLLLVIMLLSMTIPVIEITVSPAREQVANADIVTPNSEEMQLSSIYMDFKDINGPEATKNDNISNIIFIFSLIYLAGIIFMLGRFIFMYIHLFKLFASNSMRKVEEEGFTIYIHDRDIIPMSWMNRILISEIDYRENGTEIVAHEAAHISKRHSYDLILTELFVIIHWFNPAVWLIRRELKAIHEYQADKAVIDQGIDAKNYQLLLIKKAVGDRLYSIANSFNHSKLKNRITMITVKKSKNRFALKALFIAPLSMIAIIAFASNQVVSAFEPILKIKVNDFIAEQQDTTKIVYLLNGKILSEKEFKSLDQKEFASVSILTGDSAMKKLYGIGEAETAIVISTNFDHMKPDTVYVAGGDDGEGQKKVVKEYYVNKYKKETKTEIFKPLYVIDGKTLENADINSIDPENIKSISVLKDKTAVALYGDAAKNGVILISTTENGEETDKIEAKKLIDKILFEEIDTNRVRMTLLGREGGSIVGESSSATVTIKSSGKEREIMLKNLDPLYVVNGEVLENTSMDKIDPYSIIEITVLSSEDGVKKYGEKAKKGAIEITTKK